MAKSTLKDLAAERAINYIVPTGAIRSSEWLCVETVDGIVLYVADENAAEAAQLWPGVPLREIDNRVNRLGPRSCAN